MFVGYNRRRIVFFMRPSDREVVRPFYIIGCKKSEKDCLRDFLTPSHCVDFPISLHSQGQKRLPSSTPLARWYIFAPLPEGSCRLWRLRGGRKYREEKCYTRPVFHTIFQPLPTAWTSPISLLSQGQKRLPYGMHILVTHDSCFSWFSYPQPTWRR